MPRRKDINNDVREAIVAARQSGKGYKAIYKQYGVYRSTDAERFFTSGKHSRLP